MSVSENVRRLREEKGINQAELARRAGVTQSMICQIERGTRVPSLPLGAEIAQILGCKVTDLLETRGAG